MEREIVQGEGEHLVWINHAVDNVAFKARLTPPPASAADKVRGHPYIIDVSVKFTQPPLAILLQNGQSPFHSAVSRRIRVESLSDRLALLSFHRPQPYSAAVAAGPSTAHSGCCTNLISVSIALGTWIQGDSGGLRAGLG